MRKLICFLLLFAAAFLWGWMIVLAPVVWLLAMTVALWAIIVVALVVQ